MFEVEPGEVHVELDLDGRARPEGGSFDLTLAAGEARIHRLDLHLPTAPLAGRVTFPGGEPVVGATLEASALRPEGGTALKASCASDGEGRFRLDLPEGWSCRVSARLGHEESVRDGIAPGRGDLDLVLSRQGRLFFRLVDARDGTALDPANFQFAWRRAGEAEFHEWGVGPFPQLGLDGWYPDRLPSGRLDLRVLGKADPSTGTLLEAQAIPEDGEPPRLEFRIQPR